MNLDTINKVNGRTGQTKTHNAIHIQVKVVELDFIRVRTRHINRNDYVIAILIWNLCLVLLDDVAD